MIRELIHENAGAQRTLARVTFAVFDTQTKVNDRIKLPIISTGRPFSYYRKVFFQGRSEAEVLRDLQGKRIADVGCGLTPFVGDSMFQACERAGIEFYGIDPKIGKDFVFGPFDRIKVWATGGRGRLDPRAPGTQRALSASADELPFDNDALDLILSSFLLSVWISDARVLNDIYAEFHRVLKPGGQVKVYPQALWSPRRARDIPALAGFDVRQEFKFDYYVMSYPPAYVTTLTKK